MKKIILSLMALATMAFAFNSCSDVPEPYATPEISADTTKVVPSGTGTADDPYNIAMVKELYNSGQLTVGTEIYIKGVITNLTSGNYSYNDQYHNYTYCINDKMETNGEFTIFRGKNLGNTDFTSASQLQLGDTVVIFGKLTTYNNNPQLDQGNYLYSLNGQKAPETPAAEAKGSGTEADPYNSVAANAVAQALEDNGKVENVYVTGKVSQVTIDTNYGNATYYISDDGTSSNQFEIYRGYYLNGDKFTSTDQLKVGDSVVVKGTITKYVGNSGNATLEMTQGSQLVSINGSGNGGTTTKGDGTEANPYSASEAYAVAAALDASGKVEGVYITGIVSSVKEVSTRFGNATFNISDDGTTNGSQFTIYRVKYLNGENFTSEDQVKVGDKVVVKGDIVNYRGNTPETSQGGQIISIEHNGDTPSENKGTQANPYSASEAIAAAQTLDESGKIEGVFVSGTISEIRQVSTSYGNANYYISDDGTTGTQFYIFRGYYLNGDKFTSEDQIKVGNKVVIKGDIVNYKGNTPEMSQGSQIISIN